MLQSFSSFVILILTQLDVLMKLLSFFRYSFVVFSQMINIFPSSLIHLLSALLFFLSNHFSLVFSSGKGDALKQYVWKTKCVTLNKFCFPPILN